MKILPRSLLFFMILITACAPQNTATQLPTPVSTNTPPATATLEPTLTLDPTPISILVVEIWLDSCAKIVESKISSAGSLEIVFEGSSDGSSTSIISEFGSADGVGHFGLWLWSEDTQEAVLFPLSPDALGAKLASGRQWVLFRRDTSQTQSELWVVGVDGKGEKKLASVVVDPKIKARHPDGMFWLEYEWIPNTDRFYYSVNVTFGAEYEPTLRDQFVLVDANSGRTMPLANAAQIQEFHFSPDGSQLAVQTKDELSLLNTSDGHTQFTLPTVLDSFLYSPNGDYIIDFIDEGILRINSRDGQQEIIPLEYTILSLQAEPSAYGPLPSFRWEDNSTLLLTSLDSDQRYVSLIPFADKPDSSWTFTIWQIDLAHGTTLSVQTFSGDPSTARFSPDGKRLAFQKYERVAESVARYLYLADVATGEILQTIAGGLFEVWYPDSQRYFYATGIPFPPPGKGDPGKGEVIIRYYLGQVGETPLLVNWDASAFRWSQAQRIDEHRLVKDCKIITLP